MPLWNRLPSSDLSHCAVFWHNQLFKAINCVDSLVQTYSNCFSASSGEGSCYAAVASSRAPSRDGGVEGCCNWGNMLLEFLSAPFCDIIYCEWIFLNLKANSQQVRRGEETSVELDGLKILFLGLPLAKWLIPKSSNTSNYRSINHIWDWNICQGYCSFS